jgi:hypothetical protein
MVQYLCTYLAINLVLPDVNADGRSARPQKKEPFMPILESTLTRTSFPAGLARFLAEAGALADAFLQPGRLAAQVEQMGALLRAANAVHRTDPARAAVLRQRASRIRLG